MPGEFDTQGFSGPNQPPLIQKHLGNILTTTDAPYVHYQCGCSRQYIDAEMYICFKCSKILCKYCLS